MHYIIMRKIKSLLCLFHMHEFNTCGSAGATDKYEWISTGLYLSPGMKTDIIIPPKLLNNKWTVQYIISNDD